MIKNPPVVQQSVNGIETATAIIGEGRPVIALHGWGATLESFRPVAERLAPLGYQIHLLDFPGFGGSALPPAVWSVSDYARFIVDYLDQNGLEKVNVLGHSFGGRVALVLASEYASRIGKMVLADSAGIPNPLPLKNRVAIRGWHLARTVLETLRLKGLSEKLRGRFYRRFASDDYLNAGPLRDTFRTVIQEDLTPYAQRVQAPTVLIWGDMDQDTPVWQGRRLEKLIADAALIVFEGAGHFAFQERLADYVRIVDAFFRS